jgi:hypothetical protein
MIEMLANNNGNHSRPPEYPINDEQGSEREGHGELVLADRDASALAIACRHLYCR